MSTNITVLYDNVSFEKGLKTAWGYAALIDHYGTKLLFDSGGDSPTLLGNMLALGIDPPQIDSILLSHAHKDHTGGLIGLLRTGIQPNVYLHPAFPEAFKKEVARLTNVIETEPGMEIADGLLTTGEMSGKIPEQALLIHAERGIVIVTGCAHPGIVRVIEWARSLTQLPILLAMGGFHLKDHQQTDISLIIEAFRRLCVKKIAPSHCTGDAAINLLSQAYARDFIQSGVGKVVRLA